MSTYSIICGKNDICEIYNLTVKIFAVRTATTTLGQRTNLLKAHHAFLGKVSKTVCEKCSFMDSSVTERGKRGDGGGLTPTYGGHDLKNISVFLNVKKAEGNKGLCFVCDCNSGARVRGRVYSSSTRAK